jgi:hypothetical protein
MKLSLGEIRIVEERLEMDIDSSEAREPVLSKLFYEPRNIAERPLRRPDITGTLLSSGSIGLAARALRLYPAPSRRIPRWACSTSERAFLRI